MKCVHCFAYSFLQPNPSQKCDQKCESHCPSQQDIDLIRQFDLSKDKYNSYHCLITQHYIHHCNCFFKSQQICSQEPLHCVPGWTTFRVSLSLSVWKQKIDIFSRGSFIVKANFPAVGSSCFQTEKELHFIAHDKFQKLTVCVCMCLCLCVQVNIPISTRQ